MSPVCSARRRRLQGLSAAIRMFAVGLGGTAVRAAVSPGERAAVLCRLFQLNDEDHPLSLRSGWGQAEALSLAMVLMIAQGPSASSAISAGGAVVGLWGAGEGIVLHTSTRHQRRFLTSSYAASEEWKQIWKVKWVQQMDFPCEMWLLSLLSLPI